MPHSCFARHSLSSRGNAFWFEPAFADHEFRVHECIECGTAPEVVAADPKGEPVVKRAIASQSPYPAFHFFGKRERRRVGIVRGLIDELRAFKLAHDSPRFSEVNRSLELGTYGNREMFDFFSASGRARPAQVRRHSRVRPSTTEIGCAKSRRIVNAVAEHRDWVAFAAQSVDVGNFDFGRKPCSDFAKPELSGNGFGSEAVIAGFVPADFT